ncbi:LysR substrate-binding domain-containing protein [Pseudomonas sp. 10B1]|uniref:LysR substrate-binding domain-containing protein n=1 Tax=unclassified Pseudomonas TaxID=196821 RepID=UPI002B22A4C1|nr:MULTISPECIES: LysR substrate-binding domain-containing protein [unclassified Pseudomonas]MEA9995100.1 LysR substrate-binding domain-containing protein [Pseudomonas sp. AA4]MEB0086949.1 LysR substrate-binding domain-containing protein [Pseudomonas sp. RTI1]MEB0126784.1 LysR substrate-binding domain-containing protein [Pseudomonas sp. CCC1.2]MEB0152435.1 LysR substrate-binding domain-containing protein [Pseudomonas sp. CCC4.3]MEB0219538.1 LysR substrate-binding domain-containing protein [Pseu
MQSMLLANATDKPNFQLRLPPLRGLEVFAAAARYGTFSRAAKELFVTQSAVSRQIQQLEEHLGVILFIRHKTGLRMTPEAEALLPVVDDAFARLTNMCNSLRTSSQVLTLRMPPTLATRWFLPLLPSLRLLMPDVDVRVTTYDAWEPRFEDSDIDAAIIHGRGDWKGVEAIALMAERLTPVCSPEMAKRLTQPADLKSMPLLHCIPANGWSRWLEAAGVGSIASHRGQTFDTLDLALSAATRGQGVALGDLNLVRESLKDGVLVAPFETELNQGIGYYLIYPAARAQLPKIRALREWLLDAV